MQVFSVGQKPFLSPNQVFKSTLEVSQSTDPKLGKSDH